MYRVYSCKAAIVADLEIDFQSEVAAKYQLIPAAADEVSNYQPKNSLRDIPENQWPLYLGRIVPIGKTKTQRLSTEKLGNVVRALVAGLEGKTEPFHVIVLKIVHELGEVIVSNTLASSSTTRILGLGVSVKVGWPL